MKRNLRRKLPVSAAVAPEQCPHLVRCKNPSHTPIGCAGGRSLLKETTKPSYSRRGISCLENFSCYGPQRPERIQPATSMNHLRNPSEGAVAAENFIAAKTGKYHLKSRIMRKSRDAKTVKAVNAWLIRTFQEIREQFFCCGGIEPPIGVLRTKMLRGVRRDIPFVEFRIIERNAKGAQFVTGISRSESDEGG